MAKDKITISVCITVLNEERNIGKLIYGLIGQNKLPNEIILVDGGSSDNTCKIISDTKNKFRSRGVNLKIKVAKGTTIAQARNISIDMASGSIILLTDAGCVPDKNWVKEITKYFKSADDELLVAGFYKMHSKTHLAKSANVYLGVPPQLFDSKTFLPSARSVAFSKSVWKQIGGFDESLERGGEDTKFFYECVKRNVKIIRSKKAFVNWVEMEDMDLKTIAKKFYVYAKGDGQASIWWHPKKQFSSHNIKISLVFIRYILGITITIWLYLLDPQLVIIPAFIFLIYLFYAIYKWRVIIKNWQSRLWLPVIQIISDIQVMRGFLSGIIGR